MKMNIKDIMEQMQETPSPRCWESIASQLPAAGAAVGGGTAATAAKGALSAGKLAAIIGSATAVVAIVTGTTFAIINHEPASVPQNKPESNTTILVSENTDTTNIDMDTTTFPEAIPSSTHTPLETPHASTSSNIEKLSDSETSNPYTTLTAANTTDYSAPVTTPSAMPANSNPSISPISSSPKNSLNTVSNNHTISQASSSQENKQTETETITQSKPEVDNFLENTGYSRPVIIEIPNIFTPNGDGVNDQFVINGLENCEKKVLIVKNQNGQIVFQSQSYDNSWDGNNLPDGTYYYQFNYSINNISELRRGTILIRR